MNRDNFLLPQEQRKKIRITEIHCLSNTISHKPLHKKITHKKSIESWSTPAPPGWPGCPSRVSWGLGITGRRCAHRPQALVPGDLLQHCLVLVVGATRPWSRAPEGPIFCQVFIKGEVRIYSRRECILGGVC
eukprot:TRINITY_DN3802_c0_g1_i12.p1 TRINITY_DN3802_c0_g1~~TRINITY_DN3802_c0_g1_i12.p1  ORF type:complete len:132 (-),score=14.10 TRINITY_DN3802_c0_g1_i12:96-491(-)